MLNLPQEMRNLYNFQVYSLKTYITYQILKVEMFNRECNEIVPVKVGNEVFNEFAIINENLMFKLKY